MTLFRSPSRLLLGAAGLALAAMPFTAHADSFTAAKVVQPLSGLSFDVGSKKAVGYYVVQDGACDLTLLVGDVVTEADDLAPKSIPARFSSLIQAGRSARIDTGEGKRVEFVCSAGAQTLLTRVTEQMAYAAPSRK